jgi:hemerythrin superfamily protein
MTDYVKNASVTPHLIDSRDPPAIALLKEDHQIFRALFDLVETISEDVLFPIAGEICIRLTIHMNLEEEFLYPSLMSVLDPDEIEDAMLDHQRAKLLISNIMAMTGHKAPLRAELQRLGKEVVNHADEEDRELLRDARRAWEEGEVDLVGIGIQMHSRRLDLFNLVGSAASETCAFDVDLPSDAVECLAESGSSVDGEAWPERADLVSHGLH